MIEQDTTIKPLLAKDLGLTPEDIENFRKDPELIEFIRRFTGRDFPMSHIGEPVIIYVAGMVECHGIEEALKIAKESAPREMKVWFRAAAMRDKIPRIEV